MANPIAVPGTNVPSGAAVSPGGAQGVTGTAGIPAWTTCTSSFTIPAVGSTVSVPVVDTSWITTGEMIYVDQAGGTGQSGILQVTGKAGNTLTLLNPTPAPAIPPADVTQAGLLKQLSGNTTDFVDGTNTCQNLVTAVQPTIWSVRLRSFNSLGNSTFEVDQRNVNAVVPNIGNAFACDRWLNQKSASAIAYSGQAYTTSFPNFVTGAPAPNANFHLSRSILSIVLTTQQTTLAANDYGAITQTIEGPGFRELSLDVHSVTLLGYTNVSGGIKVGIAIRDPTGTRSLVKLATIGTSWTIIQLPNLPAWPTAGAFSWNPGAAGYIISVTLAAGSTYTTPANDTWQNGNFFGAVGQDNFGAKPLNSAISIGFIQHEPGALCTTLIDCPFTQNYDDCLRYFSKAGYAYGTKPGTVDTGTPVSHMCQASQHPYQWVPLKKSMAKTPSITFYSAATGAVNNVRNLSAGTDLAISGINSPGTEGFSGPLIASPPASSYAVGYHYSADTGW